jgi:site-specific DNA recombinase
VSIETLPLQESTVIGWEDNIRTYLGHTIFNRHNEKIKEGGRSQGFLHGKKWKPEEQWIVTEDTHTPLISQETADKIISSRKKGHRASPSHANYIYILSGGILQCSVCGTNYAGDRGYYCCNSRGKTGSKCMNGNIKQERIESAMFALVEKEVLNFRNIKQVVSDIRGRFGNRNAEIGTFEKDFLKVKEKIRKTILLYHSEVIKADELENIIIPLRKQEEAISERIKTLKESDKLQGITDNVIKEVIEHFREEVRHADPEIKKRVARTLFESIVIHPKNNESRDRLLSIKGICLPLTRDFLVTPRGIEPLLPA